MTISINLKDMLDLPPIEREIHMTNHINVAATPMQEMPPVPRATQRIDHLLGDLREEIGALEERLSGALHPESPASDKTIGTDSPQQSPLANTLESFGDSIHALTVRLNNLKHRIEV